MVKGLANFVKMSSDVYNVNVRPRVLIRGDTMSISGTRPTVNSGVDRTIPIEDIMNDAQLALAIEGSRFSRAQRILRANPQIKYVTGHSLGGSIALALARDNPNVQAVTFNPGFPPKWAADWKIKGKPKNVKIYRTHGDPVSLFSTPWATSYMPRHLDVHGVANFENLK